MSQMVQELKAALNTMRMAARVKLNGTILPAPRQGNRFVNTTLESKVCENCRVTDATTSVHKPALQR
jgi:hypothetical protein